MDANLTKRLAKGILMTMVFITLVLLGSIKVNAHSGRTDSSGGHNCNVGSCAGTYHYHNGGSSYTPPNYYEQGAAAGKTFAYGVNRPNIESSASVEGNYEGNLDGSSGYTSTPTHDDSVEHCSPERRFTDNPTQTYKDGFMSTFTPACIEIYKAKFDTSYSAANQAAKVTFEANQAKELAAKAESNTESSTDRNDSGGDWWGWVVLGGFVGIPLVAAGWEPIKKYFE